LPQLIVAQANLIPHFAALKCGQRWVCKLSPSDPLHFLQFMDLAIQDVGISHFVGPRSCEEQFQTLMLIPKKPLTPLRSDANSGNNLREFPKSTVVVRFFIEPWYRFARGKPDYALLGQRLTFWWHVQQEWSIGPTKEPFVAWKFDEGLSVDRGIFTVR
jgi:hypothetical protein